jgi:hypothetical protein
VLLTSSAEATTTWHFQSMSMSSLGNLWPTTNWNCSLTDSGRNLTCSGTAEGSIGGAYTNFSGGIPGDAVGFALTVHEFGATGAPGLQFGWMTNNASIGPAPAGMPARYCFFKTDNGVSTQWRNENCQHFGAERAWSNMSATSIQMVVSSGGTFAANFSYRDFAWIMPGPAPTPLPTSTPVPTITPTATVIPGVTATPWPPPPIIPNPGGGGINPPGNSWGGRTCYQCSIPKGTNLGHWIAYLACVIVNLFTCSVYTWFNNIWNAVIGVYGWLVALITWLGLVTQQIYTWVGGIIMDATNFVFGWWQNVANYIGQLPGLLLEWFMNTQLVQSVWRFVSFVALVWSAARLVAAGVVDSIRNLFNAVVYIMELFIELIQAMRAAWSADPYELDIIPGHGANTPGGGPAPLAPDQLAADGINTTKIYWILLMAMVAFDSILAPLGIVYVQWVAIGLISIGLIAWTLNKWRDILPV